MPKRFQVTVKGLVNDFYNNNLFNSKDIQVAYTSDKLGKTLSVSDGVHMISIPFDGIEQRLYCPARPQGEFAEKLKDRIEESVCKCCQMNKHCELCEISRVFQIITLMTEEQKGGAE